MDVCFIIVTNNIMHTPLCMHTGQQLFMVYRLIGSLFIVFVSLLFCRFVSLFNRRGQVRILSDFWGRETCVRASLHGYPRLPTPTKSVIARPPPTSGMEPKKKLSLNNHNRDGHS